MYEIKNILVPIDFSTCSRLAFRRATALAQQLGARVTVFHVAEVSPAYSSLRLATERGGTLGEHVLAKAKLDLEAFLGQLTPAETGKPEVRFAVGTPRECILKEAEEGKYDLIVMGTHGRTGRPHELAGSVAESVVRTALCPVMTVREND